MKMYRYNNRKDLVAITEKDIESGERRKTELIYDRRHLLQEIKDESGTVVSYEYRADGKKRKEKRGQWITSYEYDQAGRVSVIKRGKKGSSEIYRIEAGYAVDIDGRERRTVTDGLGGKKVLHFDEWKRLTEQENEKGEVYQKQYSAAGRLTKEMSGHGGRYTYGYKDGDLIAAGKEGEKAAVREYSPSGRLIKTVERTGETSEYEYTKSGQIKRIKKEGGYIGYRYDKAGRVIEKESYTKRNGQRYLTHIEYNGRKRIIQSGNIIRIQEVNGWGEVIREQDGEGFSTFYHYNSRGAVEEIKDDIGIVARYKYNALGLVEEERRGSEQAVVYTYNALALLESAVQDGKEILRRKYDPAGRLIAEKRKGQPLEQYGYDEIGRITEEKRAGVIQAEYEYGAYGRTVTVKDSKGAVSTYTKDAYGLLTEEQNRIGGVKSYRYDAHERLIAVTDYNGKKQRSGYEGAREQKRYSDGSVYETVYDILGNLIEEKGPASDVRYSYDSAGLLIKMEDKKAGVEIHYRYNKAGHRTEMETNDRHVVYDVDGRGRVTTVTDRKQFIKVRLGYDENNREIQRENGNGTIEYRSYTEEGELAGVVLSNYQGAVLYAECYGYDSEGRKTYTADSKGGLTRYSYDKDYRLEEVGYPYSEAIEKHHLEEAEETGLFIDKEKAGKGERELIEPVVLAGIARQFALLKGAGSRNLGGMIEPVQMVWKEKYKYDTNGNITEKTTPYGTIHYTYDKENRLLTRGSVHYSYDGEGNLLEEKAGNEWYVKKYAYTAFNRIAESDVTDFRGKKRTITGYGYDSLQRRVVTAERNSSGEGMRAIYDGLSFELIKEAVTLTEGGGITSNLAGYANLNSYNPTGSEHTKGSRYYWIRDSGSERNTVQRQGFEAKEGYTVPGRLKGVKNYLYVNGQKVAVNNLYNTNHGQYYYTAGSLGSVKVITNQTGYIHDSTGKGEHPCSPFPC